MKCTLCDDGDAPYGIGGLGFLCFKHWEEYTEDNKKILQDLLDVVKKSD